MRLFADPAMNRAVTRVDYAVDCLFNPSLNDIDALAIGLRFAAKPETWVSG